MFNAQCSIIKEMKYDYKKQLRSFKYAWKGICACVGKEQNLDFHLLVMVLVIIAGFYFGITRMEWVAVVLCFGLVISAELFNSAVERLTNLAHPDYSELAGKVKDIAAGAVLVTAIAAAAVGLIIFVPYIF
jgi:diacylglycerol kinase (ATP)